MEGPNQFGFIIRELDKVETNKYLLVTFKI